jgi:tRNA(adenine34) deaminase
MTELDPAAPLAWKPWMERALDLARRAAAEEEVPIGAVVVRAGELLGEGWNRTETLRDPTAHAEMLALKRACARADNWRLPGAALVTTLEPCVMCFGALLEARVETLVIGATDSQRGATLLWKSGQLSRYPVGSLRLVEGVEAESCRVLLERWFAARRGGARADEK